MLGSFLTLAMDRNLAQSIPYHIHLVFSLFFFTLLFLLLFQFASLKGRDTLRGCALFPLLLIRSILSGSLPQTFHSEGSFGLSRRSVILRWGGSIGDGGVFLGGSLLDRFLHHLASFPRLHFFIENGLGYSVMDMHPYTLITHPKHDAQSHDQGGCWKHVFLAPNHKGPDG